MVDKTPIRDFTFPACPHCGQRLLRRHGAELPPIPALIFDLIEASRSNGVKPEALAWTFFPNKPARAAAKLVAVHVNRINDFLQSTDVRVRMTLPRGGAYVVSRGFLRGPG